MSKVSDRLIQLTLRARDFLSKDLKPASEAVKELAEEGRHLKEALTEAGKTRDMARMLRDNQSASDSLAKAWEDARATLEDLTREYGDNENATAGQRIALREARQTAEAAEHRQRLLALEAYRKAQLRVALLGREVGAASADDLKQAQQGLAAVQREMKAIEKAADFTADAVKGRLTTGALELVEQFNAVRRSGKDAEEALAELGKSFDPSNADQLRDMGVLLQYLGQYGVLSGEQIQQFLIAKLDKLSGEDLLKVQQVAKEVFDGLGRGAGALGMGACADSVGTLCAVL
ncbi:hypothetical protein [Ectopseudomonas mendocina]|uniref:hypothetical protein n=1 Tax=Ectopseudomonas mendocina TaxID=300 RepID=UPI003F047AA1